ncbi:MAG: HlyD family efflux transporter periplasmic adaptor subunit [Pirellulales bacterium]
MKQDLAALPPRTERSARTAGRSPIIEAIRIGAPIGILILGFIAFKVLSSLKAAPQNERTQAVAPMVETIVVQPHTGGLDFTVDGLVTPFREIDLAAEVTGRIAKRSDKCRAGTYVSAGTPLIEIDARDYELEAERLKREMAQAAVQLEELDVEVSNTKALIGVAKQQHALQRKELQRQEQLASRKIVSDTELEQSKRDELAALNSVIQLENQLQLFNTRRGRLVSAHDLCQSQLAKAQLDLARTKVVAPIDGVIIREMVQEDSYVQKGTSLAMIEDTSAVEVKCNLRMEDLYWLWAQTQEPHEGDTSGLTRDYQIPRAPVTVSYELGGRRYTWEGVLSRFDGIGLDERTRTVPCRVLVANPRQVLRVEGDGDEALAAVGPPALVRGMYVTVSVHAQPLMTLLEIPQRSLQPGNRVWQVADGKLTVHQVRVADADEDIVLIYADGSGLQPGMKLVSSPLAVAVDGMAIQEQAAR